MNYIKIYKCHHSEGSSGDVLKETRLWCTQPLQYLATYMHVNKNTTWVLSETLLYPIAPAIHVLLMKANNMLGVVFICSKHKISPSRNWKARAEEIIFAFRDKSYIHGELDINKGILSKQWCYSKCQYPSIRNHWMINYFSPYSFCLPSTCNETGVLRELSSP